MHFSKNANIYYSIQGYREGVEQDENGLVRVYRRQVKFDLGKVEQVAIEKDKKIKEAWERCQEMSKENPETYRKPVWVEKELIWLRQEGIISHRRMKSLTPVLNTGNRSTKIHVLNYTAEELQDSQKFGQWLLVRMNQKLRSETFMTAFETHLDKLMKNDPFGAAKLYLDFSERIHIDKQLAPVVNPVQLNVFCNDERNVEEKYPIIEAPKTDEPENK